MSSTLYCFVLFLFYRLQEGFKCVLWKTLWHVLREMGVSPHLISLEKGLYGNNTANVKIDGDLSKAFNVTYDVRQGCVFAP